MSSGYPLYPTKESREIFELRLNRKDKIVGDYLTGLEPGEFEIADNASNELYDAKKPLADTVVIIPVAAAQEADNIDRAARQYARQRTEKPFSVVFGLNIDFAHASSDDEAVEKTVHAVEKAKQDYPNLDLRSSFSVYADPTIGEIRRDLWNSVLVTKKRDIDTRQNQSEDLAATEVIGVNHDIDVVTIPQLYLGAIQRHFNDKYHALDPAHAQTKHAFSPNHPVLSRAVFWQDFVASQARYGYEAGTVIPMSYYALKNGFDASKRTYEVLDIAGSNRSLITTGYLETSPRRYIDRLGTYGFGEIWTDASFGSDNACRDENYIKSKPDLTEEELETLLTSEIPRNVDLIMEYIGDFTKGNRHVLERKLRVVKRALGLVFPDMSDTRMSSMVDDKSHQRIIDRIVGEHAFIRRVESMRLRFLKEHSKPRAV